MNYSRSSSANRARSVFLGWLVLSGAVAAQSPPPSDQPASSNAGLAGTEVAILNDAASIYRAASNLQLKGTKVIERHDEFVDHVARSSFSLVLTPDNRFRQETTSQAGEVLHVCDGQKHWTYTARTHRYSAAPVSSDPLFLFGGRVDLRFLTDRLLSAQFLRQEDLQMDSGKHLCDVIQAHYQRADPAARVQFGDVLFWIDHTSHWVWKVQSELHAKVGDTGTTVTNTETTVYTDVQMNVELAADAFAFVPPPGATEQASAPPASRLGLLGRPAPDFKLTSLDGEEVQLSALKGKVVLLDFWASGSEPDRAALPSLLRLSNEFRQQDVVIVGINRYEDAQTVRAFLGTDRYEYPIVICPRGNPVIESYAVGTLPTLVLIDKNGVVSLYRTGFTSATEETLRTALVRVTGPGYVSPQPGGPDAAGVYSVGNGVTAPVPTYKPDPHYSKEALKAKYEGTVVLWITIDASGAVTECRVVKPLGLGLDEQAVETVKTWKFNPATKEGAPVPVRVMVEVSFKLGDWAHRSQ
jgi:TonB family protein